MATVCLHWARSQQVQQPPRHRRVVAALLEEAETWLWPDAQPTSSELGPKSEIVAAYAYRSELSPRRWWELFARSSERIDLLGYTLYFLWEQHPRLPGLLVDKAGGGCAVRLIITDPDCQHVRMRDAEEQAAITLGARVQTTMRYLPGSAARVAHSPRILGADLQERVIARACGVYLGASIRAGQTPVLLPHRVGPKTSTRIRGSER